MKKRRAIELMDETLAEVDRKSKEVREIYTARSSGLGPPRLMTDGRQMYYSRSVRQADLWLVTLG